VHAAADGHRVLLHRLEETRLRLGRRPVDLVGEDELTEDRTRNEARARAPLVVMDEDTLPVTSAGIRSGVNWIR
jgi:hypothetical protein